MALASATPKSRSSRYRLRSVFGEHLTILATEKDAYRCLVGEPDPSAAQGPKVRRLFAGGNWIRTIGPAPARLFWALPIGDGGTKGGATYRFRSETAMLTCSGSRSPFAVGCRFHPRCPMATAKARPSRRSRRKPPPGHGLLVIFIDRAAPLRNRRKPSQALGLLKTNVSRRRPCSSRPRPRAISARSSCPRCLRS
jgi:hypothetical protein